MVASLNDVTSKVLCLKLSGFSAPLRVERIIVARLGTKARVLLKLFHVQ